MHFHNFLSGNRIGEASNPGPKVRIAVINPTALNGKTDDIINLNSQIILASETSATDYAQKLIMRDFEKKSFKCSFSNPVPDKKLTQDGRPSLRGDAIGTAVISNTPFRQYRGEIPHVLQQSCRFSCGVAQFQNLEILLVAIYGFPQATLAMKRQNDLLLGLAYKVAVESGLPFIIGGDFNTSVPDLPVFQEMNQHGHVEIFSYFAAKGIQLPPTCRGATRNDTCIVHANLAPKILSAEVVPNEAFDAHSPMLLTLDLSIEKNNMRMWKTPSSWKDINVLPQNLESTYMESSGFLDDIITHIDSVQKGDEALLQWSQAVEKAVDHAVHLQHCLDPLRNPLKCLPAHAKGRCNFRPCTHRPTIKLNNDRFASYNPKVEVFKSNNKLRVKQVRRIRSLIRASESFSRQAATMHPDQHASIVAQLQGEWNKILHAQGFGKSWYNWVLGFEQFPCIPLQLPSLEMLYEFAQLTEFACEASCNHEAACRKKQFNYRIQIDDADNFGSLTYKIIKNKHVQKLQEVPHQKVAHVQLLRMKKGIAKFKLTRSQTFLLGQKAKLDGIDVLISDQQGDTVFIKAADVQIPSEGELVQDFIATEPQDVAQAFSTFWQPFWMRDEPHDQFSSHQWGPFLSELDECDFPNWDINITINDPQVWFHTIKKLKNGKASGICGWSHQELKMLPYRAVEHLTSIFAKIWKHGLSFNMMQARVAILAKCEQPRSINDGRPITILPVLYRLAAKIVFDQTVAHWANKLPPQISGGLPGRGVRDISMLQTLHIEKGLFDGNNCCGTTMDLMKSFNMVPRLPAAILMRRMGLSWDILSFWMMSLSRMTRIPVISGYMGDSIPSTTGVPEGCTWSILAMVHCSTLKTSIPESFLFLMLTIGHGWPHVPKPIFMLVYEHSTLLPHSR
jgi:hypothetical protein